MSTIFRVLEKHSCDLDSILAQHSQEVISQPYSWTSKQYLGKQFRRATLDVIAAKNLWMMHCCVFPKHSSAAPIYGFDIVAGPNKVTGAFLDYSPLAEHTLVDWFGNTVGVYNWNKVRELPQWAKQIFSPHMLAIGNIQTTEELHQVLHLSLKTLHHYLNNLVVDEGVNSLVTQNYYCQQQKQNPHTKRVLRALGFEETTVEDFIQHELFPECVGSHTG